MKYKDDQIAEDYASGPVNPRLKTVCNECDAWLFTTYQKEMFMTGLIRTKAEQAAIYPDNPTKPSPHLITGDNPLCRAADFRRSHLTPEELVAFVGFFSNKWGAAHKALLLVDDRGPAHPHLHIAVYKNA